MIAMTDHNDALVDILAQTKHLEGLHQIEIPDNEDSAVSVIVRYFADRGVVCTEDEARRIVREGTATSD